jgi:hypothetical protein
MSLGLKGWVCWNPEIKRLYCTRNVVFDETFMPLRVVDQRILGHYDTTPPNQFTTLIHCSYEKAQHVFDKINQLPLVSTLEMIDKIDLIDTETLNVT